MGNLLCEFTFFIFLEGDSARASGGEDRGPERESQAEPKLRVEPDSGFDPITLGS